MRDSPAPKFPNAITTTAYSGTSGVRAHSEGKTREAVPSLVKSRVGGLPGALADLAVAAKWELIDYLGRESYVYDASTDCDRPVFLTWN